MDCGCRARCSTHLEYTKFLDADEAVYVILYVYVYCAPRLKKTENTRAIGKIKHNRTKNSTCQTWSTVPHSVLNEIANQQCL